MFFPERMEKVSILVLDRDRDRVVDKLGEMGCAHIIESRGDREPAGMVDELQFRLDKVIDIFKSVERSERTGFVEKIKMISGQKELITVRKRDLDGFERKARGLLRRVEEPAKIIDEKLSEVSKEIGEIEKEIELLEKIRDFDIPSFEGRQYTVFVGEVPAERFGSLSKGLPEDAVITGHRAYGEKEILAVLCLKSAGEGVKRFLMANSFEDYQLRFEGGIKPRLKEQRKRLKNLSSRKSELIHKLEELSERWLSELKFLRKVGEIAREGKDAINKFGRTEHTYFIRAWVASKDVERVAGSIGKIKSSILKSEKPKEKEEPPVLLKNPGIIKPFERITKLYSVPRYRELDPTFLMALLFPLFFAISLTDAGYGMILLFLSLFGYILYRNSDNQAIRDLLLIAIICAVPTIIIGVLAGSIFGGLVQGILKGFGVSIPVFFDLFKKAKIALGLAIGIGWVHVFTGFLINGLNEYRNGSRAGVLKNINWVVIEFLIGLLLLWLLRYIPLSGDAVFLAAGILAISITVMACMEGPSGIMNISGILGNILSYARLFALAMATTAIALAVNEIAGLFSGLLAGVLTFFLLVFGHFFSFGINAFGGFIHSLRLHYVEFFTKFYKGGGIEFKPFKLKINTWR
jgi:V/A-type H+-transporting ATPase subunit I